MRQASFETIVRTLNQAKVPFLIVGGIAVINHGYGRTTRDVNLVLRLMPEHIHNAFPALKQIGYHPSVPITAGQFADPVERETWQREKEMKVLRFWSDEHRETPLDIFITEPFDFDQEYAAAEVHEPAPGLPCRIVCLSTLIEMKKQADRPQDRADIDELNLLHGKPSSYDRKR